MKLRNREFFASPTLVPALVAVLLAACSSPSESTGTGGAGGSGASGGGGASSTGGTIGTGGGDPGVLVGSFQLQVNPPIAASNGNPAVDGNTTLVGKINDGPSPEQIVWEPGTVAGQCQILTPRVPFCNTPCGGSAACVEDDTCQDYPTAHSAGTVTAKGISTQDGATEFEMTAVANNYQPPAAVKLAYPPFAEGDDISLSAAGDYYPSFELSAKGVAPFELLNETIPLGSEQPVTLAWTPSGDPSQSTVHVKLDISHHGGTKGKIECDTEDDGSLELDAALVGELLDLGVAGFPTVVVTRRSVGSAVIPPGRVDLVISSSVERAVLVDGLTSCTDDADCPDGQTCQDDLSCQ